MIKNNNTLSKLNVIVTAGATVEKIDPVRYLSNFSSGKQGYSIAKSLADAKANVTLVLANNSLNKITPSSNLKIIKVESCLDMLDCITKHVSTKKFDVFISCAAVCDFRAVYQKDKIKSNKDLANKKPLTLKLITNPDILAKISKLTKNRPNLVIGFCAETKNLLASAKEKLKQKSCDWIIANNVKSGVFGSDYNQVYHLSWGESGSIVSEKWERCSKEAVGLNLSARIANHFTKLPRS